MAIRLTLNYSRFIGITSQLQRFHRFYALVPGCNGLFADCQLLIQHLQSIICVGNRSNHLRTYSLCISLALHQSGTGTPFRIQQATEDIKLPTGSSRHLIGP